MDHVAGVYIEEHRVTCIIGEPNVSDLTKFSPFDRHSIEPRTFNKPGSKRLQITFTRKTGSPQKILGRAAAWLVENSDDLKFVSVACFGPFVSLRGRPNTPTEASDYGRLTSVPNYKNWGGINLHYAFSNALLKAGKSAEVRVYIDADAAAVGEYWLHARRFRGTDLHTKFLQEHRVLYLKFSRSITAGLAERGTPIGGRLHAMANVIRPKPFQIELDGKRMIDGFTGIRGVHPHSFDALISQRALEERSGLGHKKIQATENEELLWDMVSYYMADLCYTSCSLLTPSRIILGGRLTREEDDLKFAEELLDRIRGHFLNRMHSKSEKYTMPSYPEMHDLNTFITLPQPPDLKPNEKLRAPRPGLYGTLRLATAKYIEAELRRIEGHRRRWLET